jgi:hypothetical protein
MPRPWLAGVAVSVRPSPRDLSAGHRDNWLPLLEAGSRWRRCLLWVTPDISPARPASAHSTSQRFHEELLSTGVVPNHFLLLIRR